MLARSHRLLLDIDLSERVSKYLRIVSIPPCVLVWDIGVHILYIYICIYIHIYILYIYRQKEIFIYRDR